MQSSCEGSAPAKDCRAEPFRDPVVAAPSNASKIRTEPLIHCGLKSPGNKTLKQRDYKFCPLSGHGLRPALRGGRARAECSEPDCGFVHWDNPVPVVAAIVEHDEKVVLVRSIGRPPTWYGLVAGFLEQAEHPDAAVLREINEEVGLTPTRCSFLGSYAFARLNQILSVYHAEVPSLDVRLGEDELDDFRIVPVADLKPWSQGTGPALSDWLARRGYHPRAVGFGKHI